MTRRIRVNVIAVAHVSAVVFMHAEDDAQAMTAAEDALKSGIIRAQWDINGVTDVAAVTCSDGTIAETPGCDTCNGWHYVCDACGLAFEACGCPDVPPSMAKPCPACVPADLVDTFMAMPAKLAEYMAQNPDFVLPDKFTRFAHAKGPTK